MNMIYNVEDRPRFMPNLVFAVQQLLAITAATLLVPTLVNASQSTIVMDQAAALFGAGVGTLVYVLFTKRRSPVFLGSSFAFISPLIGAGGLRLSGLDYRYGVCGCGLCDYRNRYKAYRHRLGGQAAAARYYRTDCRAYRTQPLRQCCKQSQ